MTKKITIAMIACTSMALVSCQKVSIAESNAYCESQGKFQPVYLQSYSNPSTGTITCVTPYQYCSEVVHKTYYDIVDTVATQSNQQDTISKSMSEQIDKCLASVQK